MVSFYQTVLLYFAGGLVHHRGLPTDMLRYTQGHALPKGHAMLSPHKQKALSSARGHLQIRMMTYSFNFRLLKSFAISTDMDIVYLKNDISHLIQLWCWVTVFATMY
jgi:hypothetical protein